MKADVHQFKKSINESAFTLPQVAVVFDFYVTRSISGSASQKRKITDYGLSKIPLDQMLEIAKVDGAHYAGIMADKMPATLADMDLQITSGDGNSIEIDVNTPRMAYLIPYQITDTSKPQAKNGGKGESLLAHIRNAFAHGNTYFFDNNMVLLEDKKGSTVTARILISQQTLLDWIALIDKNQKYYLLQNPCMSCSKENEKEYRHRSIM